jgi:hypothetical protein|tara:strand:+ start:91 stop:378 length:288 start_codon:yes stop_codon:yes gene_type:complete
MSLPFHAGLHTLRPFALFVRVDQPDFAFISNHQTRCGRAGHARWTAPKKPSLAIGIHDHRLRSEAFLILPDIIDKLFGISGALNDLEDKKWITAV